MVKKLLERFMKKNWERQIRNSLELKGSHEKRRLPICHIERL